ncbi:hypothetical protein [Microbispora bryophytorum]|uniref:hypothetical protein n=1 Tax=Microbispora bryophytorum TaxID=1460882 RepID=UPI003402DDFB
MKRAAVLRWLETASLPLADLREASVLRRGLDAISATFSGKKAAVNTVLRKREVLNHILELAVEEKVLTSNALHEVKWTAPKTTEAVDPMYTSMPGSDACWTIGSANGRTC